MNSFGPAAWPLGQAGEIFIFRNSVMPEYQVIEKSESITKRNIFGFEDFPERTHPSFVTF